MTRKSVLSVTVSLSDGELAKLETLQDDVKKKLQNGREGGLMIDGYNDIKTDDVIEAYVMEEIKR